MYDLLIKNGHILDPVSNIDLIGDIAVLNGLITKVDQQISEPAKTVIDAANALVTAGWIDVHAHVYEYGTPNGMPMDLGAIPMGVTAMVDAGSSGVANYRMLLKELERSKTRSKIMLNVSACGIVMPSQFPEPLDPECWDMRLFEDAFAQYGDRIMGLKLRVSKGVVKELGLEPLRKAVETADHLGTRVVAHVTDGPTSMSEISDVLRGGDVFCHVYHGTGNTIINGGGVIESGIWKARERGVIFDAAAGRGNFSQAVARSAIEQGFLPDTISTDITLQNWHNTLAGSLPIVMSKYLQLGMDVSQIIERVTSEPAKQFGIKGLGVLEVGTPADITIANLKAVNIVYADKFGNKVTCDQVFEPKATIINGEIQYRAVDCNLNS